MHGDNIGDTSSLRNPESLEAIIKALGGELRAQQEDIEELSYEINATALTGEIRSLLAETLGTSVVPDVSLMQAGLTSLGILQFSRRIKRQFSFDVPATLVFDHPSLNKILSFASERS